MKYGEKVYWKNDAEQRPWFVLRDRDDSQFVSIIANPKLYPKTDMHSVPRGCLRTEPWEVTAAAPAAPESAQREPDGLTPPPASSSPAAAPPSPAMLYPDRYLPAAPARPKKKEKPAIKVPGGLDLNGLKTFAATLGLGSHDMEEIHRIWETPAPNKPMRTMRVHNYIKNAYKRTPSEE